MRRLAFALLLVGCSSSKEEPEFPVHDDNPRMPNLDGSVTDARARRDATYWTPPDAKPPRPQQVTCNDDACFFPGERCLADEDCCQPWNNPSSRIVCLGGRCDMMIDAVAPFWNQALPVCLLDGGTPPITETRSSLARCGAPNAVCLPDGGLDSPSSCVPPKAGGCERDDDCCNPPSGEVAPHACIAGYCDVLTP